jgi:hypothetical protein
MDARGTAQAPTHVGQGNTTRPTGTQGSAPASPKGNTGRGTGKGKTTRKTGTQGARRPPQQPHGGHESGDSGGGAGGSGRSDIRLKHDIVELGQLKNGIHLYRFRYNWADQEYVGVIAQEVRKIMPGAVSMGADGYLRVDYGKLGLRLETWDEWLREHPQTASKRN